MTVAVGANPSFGCDEVIHLILAKNRKKHALHSEQSVSIAFGLGIKNDCQDMRKVHNGFFYQRNAV
jgi:hypothetical protein